MSDWHALPVADLLPHSPPMVLLERVLDYAGNSLIAEVAISVDSMFYDPAIDGVPAWAGIEYMAQAIAALGGLRARERNEAIKPGFLLGTRKLLLPCKVLRAGARYQIEVKQLVWDESGLASFACRILHGATLCAEARLNVFVTANLKTPN
jgi:predicted hotdog family 3-hydroxylacyl-ACP dehydratase